MKMTVEDSLLAEELARNFLKVWERWTVGENCYIPSSDFPVVRHLTGRSAATRSVLTRAIKILQEKAQEVEMNK